MTRPPPSSLANAHRAADLTRHDLFPSQGIPTDAKRSEMK
jgi:hypothetical protein